MAKNFHSHGQTFTLTAPTGGVVGDMAYKIGTLFGVAMFTAAEGAQFELKRVGVWTLPKATGAAWAEGDALYWDDAAKKVTKTATSNTLIGAAIAVAGTGDTAGVVLLNQA